MPIDLKVQFQQVLLSEQGYLSELSPSETAEFQAFKMPKRKMEWLAGRLACKQAVKDLLVQSGKVPLQAREIIVAPSDGERPSVNIAGVQISLSHSAEYAAAVACWSTPVGVDLELLGAPDVDLMPISFSNLEQAWVYEENWRFYQFWTAKEALLKALGLGLTVDLKELRIVKPKDEKSLIIKFKNHEYSTSTYWNEKYIWSLCQIENHQLSQVRSRPQPSKFREC